MSTKTEGFQFSRTKTGGFLFIGDPHISSRRVGRRQDDYLSSVLEKLTACAQICELYELTPVILGDLFHRNDDNSLSMLNRLIGVMRLFPVTPIVLEGNHDKERSILSDNDALMLLHQTGVVRVAISSGLFDTFLIDDVPVNLLMAPYGTELPNSAPHGVEGFNVLITHHDMAFGSSYPGSQPLKAIRGVPMVVNGHMHDTKDMEIEGETHWHNPGNIEPLSVDLADHVPCAWQWSPALGPGKLEPHRLPHGTNLFDLTGIKIEAAEDAEASVVKVLENSEFAELLSSDNSMDASRTDDASVLGEDLEEVLSLSTVTAATQMLLRSLAKSVAANPTV